MPSALEWIGVLTTLVISAVVVLVDLLLILLHECHFKPNYYNNPPLAFFLQDYIIKAECTTKTAYWDCNDAGSLENSRPYTDPNSVYIFLLVHLILHVIWASSIVGILFKTRRWNVVWLGATAMVLLYSTTVTSLFSLEIADVVECYSADDALSKDILISRLILPLYLSYGGVFWLLLLVVWLILVVKQICSKEKGKKAAVGRSLSEAQSEDFAGRLNKRFDEAEAIEEQASGTSQDSLVKRPPHRHPRRLKEPTSEWVYANPALVVEEFDAKAQRSTGHQHDVYASPRSFQAMRSISHEEGSETSESRRLGRPISMPPLPLKDYRLPRASLPPRVASASGGGRSEARPIPRKAIRTPSGRSMSALEYLHGGFQPSSSSLRAEEHGN